MKSHLRLSSLRFITVLALVVLPHLAFGQVRSCDLSSALGGNSTVTPVTAIERTGTSKTNMNVNGDSVFYEVSNDAGFTQVFFTTEMISDAAADNDRAPFGVIFINPTNGPVTITQANLFFSKPTVRSSPPPLTVTPTVADFPAPNNAGSWAFVSSTQLRWTGSIVLPAHSGIDLIVEAKIIILNNPKTPILDIAVSGSAVTSAGTINTVNSYNMDVLIATQSNKVATGVVAFDSAGRFPRGYLPNLTSAQSNTLTVGVGDWAGNEAIRAGLKLRVDIPEKWSNISVAQVSTRFSPVATIVQPTATTPGSIEFTSIQDIPANSAGTNFYSEWVRINATPPLAYADSVYHMKMGLDGLDTSNPAHAINSVCDGVVHVLPQQAAGIEIEFLSPVLANSAPVRTASFTVSYNSANGLGNEQYMLDFYNRATSSWVNYSTATPGTSNTTVTRTFTSADVDDYVDSSNRMRLRFRSPGTTTTRTLRIDHMAWTGVVRGWEVNNAHVAASDLNRGSISAPLLTIQEALNRASGGDPIYVQGTAIPYAANVSSTKDGTSGCETMLFGVPDAITGQRPKVAGTNPASDSGFLVGSNFTHVEGFDITGTQVALYAAQNKAGVILRNNRATVPDLGYGVLLYANTGARVENNVLAAAGTRSQIGLWDYTGSGNVLDGNRISGNGTAGIMIWSSTGAVVRRNILVGNYIGVHVARSAATLHNNTIDRSKSIGAYAESVTSPVVSRNNIISNGPYGWRRNTTGSVDTNYDDVWNNGVNYTNVVAGANSVSVDPSFATNTSDPLLAGYYNLSSSSPVIDAGTNVGLTFFRSAPDLGAVEMP